MGLGVPSRGHSQSPLSVVYLQGRVGYKECLALGPVCGAKFAEQSTGTSRCPAKYPKYQEVVASGVHLSVGSLKTASEQRRKWRVLLSSLACHDRLRPQQIARLART